MQNVAGVTGELSTKEGTLNLATGATGGLLSSLEFRDKYRLVGVGDRMGCGEKVGIH